MLKMSAGGMKKYLCVSFILVFWGTVYPVFARAADKPVVTGKSEQAAEHKQGTEADHLGQGKKIFNNICIHCHHTDYKVSVVGAPGLRDVTARHTPEWLNQWLASPADFAKKNQAARALRNANPYGLTMPSLPEMQDPQSRRDVIEFLKTLKAD